MYLEFSYGLLTVPCKTLSFGFVVHTFSRIKLKIRKSCQQDTNRKLRANKRLVNESKHSLIQFKVVKLTFFDSSLILRLFLFLKLIDIKSSERLKCYKVTQKMFSLVVLPLNKPNKL